MSATYWLYYDNKFLASTRGPAGMTDVQVVKRALEQHSRIPLMRQGLDPWTHRRHLMHAQVRT